MTQQEPDTPQALAELFASEHAARFLELSQDFMVVADLDGRFRIVNQAFCDRLGMTREELLAQPFLELVHPEDKQATLATLGAIGEGHEVRDFENRYRRADGSYIWLQWRSSAADAKGLTYAVAREITERRRLADLMEKTQSAARIGGWELDFVSGELYWTPETYRIHETSPEEFTPTLESAIAFYAPGSLELISEAVQRARDTGEAWDLELDLITAKGRPIRVRATGQASREGERSLKVFGSFQDISERYLGERTQARLAEVLRATSDFVGIFDAESTPSFLNQAAHDLLELQPGMPFPNLAGCFAAGQRARLQGEILSTAQHTGLWSGEAEFAATTGATIPVSMVLVTHLAPHGAIEAYSIIARDLRATRALEAQMQHGRRLESIGRLAGGVAHDFNNLLTVIQGYVELMELEPAAEGFGESLSAIRDATTRASALTSQLLTFARRQFVKMRVIDPGELIRETEKLLLRLLGEDVELRCTVAEDLWRIRMDPTQFEQIIVNMAINARDAMPDGGRLEIGLGNRELSKEEARGFSDLEPGAYVLMQVRDTGCGMTADVADKIFEPFFTTKEPDQGTGLGLATTHGVVKQCGGQIWVETAPGQGCEFSMLLPRAEGAAAPKVTSESAVQGGDEGILVVEDEAGPRDMAVQALTRLGYRVFSAAGGEAAAQIAAEHGADIRLLLTDVVMPRQSGPEVARELGKQLPGLKVIYCSGYTGDRLERFGVHLADVHLLQKPYAIADLGRLVRQVLDEAAAH